MEIKVKTSKNKSWGKALVTGRVLGVSRKKQVQEHLETIYYLGLFRLVVTHKWKFIPYS